MDTDFFLLSRKLEIGSTIGGMNAKHEKSKFYDFRKLVNYLEFFPKVMRIYLVTKTETLLKGYFFKLTS